MAPSSPAQLRLPTLPAVRPAAAAAWRGVASALPSRVHLGTSSWSFPGWDGLVYDGAYRPQQLAHSGLAAYAQHPLLRCVGVDRAHYAPLPAEALRDWAEAVPAAFRFLVKAHEACTLQVYPEHARYGRHAGAMNPRFLCPSYARDQVVQPFCDGLAARSGPLLFQFAAQDVALLGGPQGFAESLHRFLDALPRGPLYAVEVRNAPLLGPAYAQALAATGAVHCFNVLPNMPSVRVQARLLRGVRFPHLVLRWMRHDGIGYEEAVQLYKPFNRLHHPDEAARSDIAWLVGRALQADVKSVFVVVNNKAEGSAPLSIRELAQRLTE